MKIFKTKFQCKMPFKRGVFVPLVFALALCCINTDAHAQTYSDLNGATINLLETAFEQEMEKLRDEIHNPQPGISIESNRNIFQYYEAVWTSFQEENVDIKEAFILELNVLQRGPVGSHDLTQVLFYKSVNDAPPVDRYELAGTSLLTSGATSPYIFFQTKTGFRNHLKGMSVTPGNINKVNGLFSYIRNNK